MFGPYHTVIVCLLSTSIVHVSESKENPKLPLSNFADLSSHKTDNNVKETTSGAEVLKVDNNDISAKGQEIPTQEHIPPVLVDLPPPTEAPTASPAPTEAIMSLPVTTASNPPKTSDVVKEEQPLTTSENSQSSQPTEKPTEKPVVVPPGEENVVKAVAPEKPASVVTGSAVQQPDMKVEAHEFPLSKLLLETLCVM